MISTVDAIFFRYFEKKLQVLTIKRDKNSERLPNVLALPGGWVFEDKDKTLEDTLTRMLHNKVGFLPNYIEAMPAVGNAFRDPDGWSLTAPFLCLLKSEKHPNDNKASWEDVDNVIIDQRERSQPKKPLPFDHNLLVTNALKLLVNKSEYSTILLNLMPKTFTLSELQHLYEIVLSAKQFKAGFRKRFLNTGLLVDTKKTKLASNGKEASLYSIKENTPDVSYFDRVMKGNKNYV